jgi:response regulator RpfG family c-di-GMP phosphodiesterase
MSAIRKYIIIDDDPFNNILCKMQIEITLGDVDIKIFEIPEEGLAFIQNDYIKSIEPIILFLDINMPTLSGWEFMEEYEKFGDEVKEQIRIFILSSSVDPRDKDKAEANKYIKGFISKPLDRETILAITSVS